MNRKLNKQKEILFLIKADECFICHCYNDNRSHYWCNKEDHLVDLPPTCGPSCCGQQSVDHVLKEQIFEIFNQEILFTKEKALKVLQDPKFRQKFLPLI